MKCLRLLLLLALVFAMVPLTTPALAAESTMVRIAHGAFNEKIAALWIGADKGLFKKHGVDVEVLQIRSGPQTMAALASGDLQMSYTIPGSVLSAKAGGMDVAFFAGLVNKPDGEIISSQAIKSPEDLKGKRIGVQSIGGGVWSLTMVALGYWGLDPKRDKMLIQVLGDQSVLVQALDTNNIDATYLSYTLANDLKKRGFHSLVDLGKTGIPYQGLALAARRAYLRENPDTVDAVLRGVLESIAFVKNPANKTAAIENLTKHLRLSRPADAEVGYQVLQYLYDYDIRPSLEGIRTMHRLLSPLNPKMQNVRSEDVIDEAPFQKLEKSGFLNKFLETLKRN